MHPISIERVEAHLVELPTLRPHRLAMHTIETQTTVILRIRCSDGIDENTRERRSNWAAPTGSAWTTQPCMPKSSNAWALIRGERSSSH